MKKHYWFLPLLALCLTGCLNDKKMTTASSRASSNKNAHIITTKKNRNSSTHPTDPNRNNNPPRPHRHPITTATAPISRPTTATTMATMRHLRPHLPLRPITPIQAQMVMTLHKITTIYIIHPLL